MLTQKFRWSIPAEFNLLSTDTKPTDCPNGSRINEIDTGKVYLFDEENKVWHEKSNSGGGGGGGGGSVTVDTTVNGASANPVQNKAIYDFVNSSVSTSTANFIGTFNSVAELNGYSGTITNNDYAFVISTDSAGNTVYNRYKYNGSAWGFEYALNNSSFTAAQWATIQSGLTATDKTKLDGIEAGANKTVVDENLSQTSTNPVQNKTVNAALGERVDTQTFTADQNRQETEIGVVANAGAKNLLKNARTTTTHRGVTFTVNDDGSVTASGTNDGTGASLFNINTQETLALSNGDYIFSGCPAGGSASGYLMDITRSTGASIKDIGDGVNFIVGGNYTINEIRIVISRNVTVDNLTFYPMIRRAEITDDTFAPYAKTNRELTVAEDADRAALIGQVDGGAKNLFNINATPIVNHTTYTLTDEKLTVSANGSWAHYSVPVDLPAGDYILSMNISDYTKTSEAPDTSMRLRMSETTSGGTSVILSTITGNGIISIPFTWGGGTLYIQFYPNYNATSYANSFSAEDVMICTAADYAISPAFVSYAPTNRELYEAKATINDIYGYGTLIPANADLNDYTTPGRYYGSNDTGNTALNLPVSNDTFTFSLDVKAATPSMTYQYITICRLADDPFIYKRRKYTTWGSWYKFEGTVVS